MFVVLIRDCEGSSCNAGSGAFSVRSGVPSVVAMLALTSSPMLTSIPVSHFGS